MLVIPAIVALYLGQIGSVASLFVATVMMLIARHPLAVLPAALAVLWTLGTVDFVDLVDGPMRIDADLNMLGTGRGVPPALSSEIGPVWWNPTSAAICFAVFTRWPKVRNLRTVALIGLACLAVSYAGVGALHLMY
jgi:hypothetical protein